MTFFLVALLVIAAYAIGVLAITGAGTILLTNFARMNYEVAGQRCFRAGLVGIAIIIGGAALVGGVSALIAASWIVGGAGVFTFAVWLLTILSLRR